MLSVFVAIAAFTSKNNTYLHQVITNYHHMTLLYNVTVEVHTVQPWTIEEQIEWFPIRKNNDHFRLEFVVFDESIELQLTCQHRRRMEQVVDLYDLFIYQEDDIDIRYHHVEMFVELTHHIERVGLQQEKEADTNEEWSFPLVGFFRYEKLDNHTKRNNNENVLVSGDVQNGGEIIPDEEDQWKKPELDTLNNDLTWSIKDPLSEKDLTGRYAIEDPMQVPLLSRCVAGIPFVADEVNPHQAFFMLTKRQILALDAKCNFFSQGEIVLKENRGQRVYMSSFSIYKHDPRLKLLVGIQENISCDAQKIVPVISFLRSSIVHHMRQRYIKDWPDQHEHSLDGWYDDFTTFAKDPEALAAGEVPYCWKQALAQGLLQ